MSAVAGNIRACNPDVAIVITAHNEGVEVRQTIESVRESSHRLYRITLVDDGSSDGSCKDVAATGIRLIRHDKRLGVAASRHEATADDEADAFVFLDAHQRIDWGAIDKCVELALEKEAIVCPDVADFQRVSNGGDGQSEILHGAYFVLSTRKGAFTADWRWRPPRNAVSRVSSLRTPAYVIPRSIYRKVRWSPILRGWGGSEAAISLKAFFAGVDILHLCGPLVRHRFKRSFHYDVGWPEVWRNHAILARIGFEDRSWYEYWLPKVFEPHLSTSAQRELESDEILAQNREFARIKVRADGEFWTHLAVRPVPTVLQ